MSDDIEYQKTPGKGKVLAGLILMVVGIGFLFNQLDMFDFPHYLFNWHLGLILLGLFIGSRNNFRNSAWYIMVAIGAILLLGDVTNINLHNVIWPLAIIGVGIWLIVKRNHHYDKSKWSKKWEDKWEQKWDDKWEKKWGNDKYRSSNPSEPVVDYTVPPADAPNGPAAEPEQAGSTSVPPPHSDDDYLDNVAVFGSINKTILSKDFKGGEIVNIFGGAELDFTQADIQGRVVIEITQVFGGTKLLVPSNWKVISDMSAVFAGIDDKRIKTPASAESSKILVLKGTSIFAGIDIRSY